MYNYVVSLNNIGICLLRFSWALLTHTHTRFDSKSSTLIRHIFNYKNEHWCLLISKTLNLITQHMIGESMKNPELHTRPHSNFSALQPAYYTIW